MIDSAEKEGKITPGKVRHTGSSHRCTSSHHAFHQGAPAHWHISCSSNSNGRLPAC